MKSSKLTLNSNNKPKPRLKPRKQVFTRLSFALKSGGPEDFFNLLSLFNDMEQNAPEIQNLIGLAYLKQEQYEKAQIAFLKAVNLDPRSPYLLYNLADSQFKLKEFSMCIENCERALKINPEFKQAHNLKGRCLELLGNRAGSIDSYISASQKDFELAKRLYLQGVEFLKDKKYVQAAESYEKAYKISGHETSLASYFDASSHVADWDAIQKYKREITKAGINETPVPLLTFLALEDAPERHLKRAKVVCKLQPFEVKSFPSPKKQQSAGRIKLGYFSADFHDHAGMHLMSRLLAVHDRTRFEVHAFSYGPKRDPEFRKKLVESVDYFHELDGKRATDIVQLSRSCEIDIALHRNGHTKNSKNEIFAQRAAPVQINYLGYPGTMGASYIDYIVADHTIIPETSRKYYSEKIIYMPHTYQPNDNTRTLPEKYSQARSKFGLPEDKFIFASFNNTNKITVDDFGRWVKILSNVEDSVLWIMIRDKNSVDNICKAALHRGINKNRFIFTKPVDHNTHMSRLTCADLILDTFNYNAHTTASDALWVGVPIVTKIGESFSARVAASLLNAIDVPELTAGTEEEYIDLSIRLAKTPEMLKKIREKLLINRSSKPLFNTELYARHLERGFEIAFQRYIDGSGPDHIMIEDQQET